MNSLVLRGPSFLFLVLLIHFALAAPVHSGESEKAREVRVGFVTTLTGQAAVIGEEMRDAANLALERLGGRMASLPVKILYRDDQLKPMVGKQVTDELVQREDVDFVVGFIWSHVLLASKGSVLDAGKFLISANAGPRLMAGRMCHDNFFNLSQQSDQSPMALGALFNQKAIQKAYLMAPNYTAGKEMMAGFEGVFGGEVVGRDLTKWGAEPQLDFLTEFAKVGASGAEALWAFYAGGSNLAFIAQYEQSGLYRRIPLYSVFIIDEIALRFFQKAGLVSVLGSTFPHFWDPTLENSANRAFVLAFREKYARRPSFYAAQAYDAMNLVNLAVTAVRGNLKDKEGMRAAMETANFPSVRGQFSFARNHFPIQNFYLREVVSDQEGRWTTEIVDVVFKNHPVPYVDECSR